MKLGTWLALLLAVILPLKGAMAAAGMLCHVPGPASAAGPLAHHDGSSHARHGHGTVAHDMSASHPAHATHAHDHAASHPAQAADVRADGGEVSDVTCVACAAICGASPLPPAVIDGVPAAETARDWIVPAVHAPPRRAPSGLERPPRSV